MKKKPLSSLALLLCFAVLITVAGCSTKPSDPGQTTTNETQQTNDPSEPTAPGGLPLSEREARRLGYLANPSNQTNEEELPKAPQNAVSQDSTSVTMQSKKFTLRFVNQNGYYSLSASSGQSEYYSAKPIILTVYSNSQSQELKAEYQSVTVTDYGCLAQGTVTNSFGSEFVVEDRYYYPDELPESAINLRRTVLVKKWGTGDIGYSTSYLFNVNTPAENINYFVPHTVYNKLDVVGRFGTFAETELGLPMVSMMTDNGFALSLARYQPIINSNKNFTASFEISEKVGDANQPGMRVDYPSTMLPTKYFTIFSQKQIVFDLSLTGNQCADYNDMMVSVYNSHFLLQNQRIVDTDIDKVLEVICEDYKSFMLSTDKGNGDISYGLPWRVTIENGKIGPKSYQSGFVGQQIPAAYQMLFYGVKAKDETSLQNGLNILNFWIDAGMMNPSGVPKIWYNGDYNVFNSYPTFLRMAIDTMEGYLDAYALAKANGIECGSWETALLSFADFLVKAQNDDGSFYRCYNWSGGMYKAGDDGLPEPEGNICQSSSKENTAMAVRFLAEMYKQMGKEEYKNAALRAGEYVYANQYSRGYYIGGTCDNANVVDKEAGVFAMYCYDAMYMLTQDEKWIAPLKQATAFTMSMVQGFSFPAGNLSSLKAALGVKAGYNDGSSFITAEMNGIDNFAAVIYYHLFRLYIITGDPIYFYQAEFMQQNSKSLMDWDGALRYPYKSLIPEATTITDFNFWSATDPDGVMGVWLPWQSVANAAPICDMLLTFGAADVADFADTPVEELYQKLFPDN
ncbi:MAG: hypothetical protein IJZ80_05970 [Clostridia bacterium]|nr:hypothetical protein [Clostridia bacterium]